MDISHTICAVSTPPGAGAIAVIRVSGEQSLPLVDALFKGKSLASCSSHTAHFGRIMDEERVVDEVVVTLFKGPTSYSGQDSIEISCHGSAYIQEQILSLLIKHGARYAEPGEFTLRAFLNGKLDLVQAEAVADLISSDSPKSHELAMKQMRGGFSKKIQALRDQLIHFASMIELELDFGEEDVEFANRDELVGLVNELKSVIQALINSFAYGNVMKRGVPVAIVGKPNAGKSTLLNQLLNEEKAIVSNIAGTTRDVIEDDIVISGATFRFIDTAGLRDSADEIEKEGIIRTRQKIEEAKIVLLVVDSNAQDNAEAEAKEISSQLSEGQELIVCINKQDLNEAIPSWAEAYEVLGITAKNGNGVEALKARFIETVNRGDAGDDTVVTNARHLQEFNATDEALSRVLKGMSDGISSDLIAMDIRQAVHHLGLITGEISTDDLLDNIFSNFCIGK